MIYLFICCAGDDEDSSVEVNTDDIVVHHELPKKVKLEENSGIKKSPHQHHHKHHHHHHHKHQHATESSHAMHDIDAEERGDIGGDINWSDEETCTERDGCYAAPTEQPHSKYTVRPKLST